MGMEGPNKKIENKKSGLGNLARVAAFGAALMGNSPAAGHEGHDTKQVDLAPETSYTEVQTRVKTLDLSTPVVKVDLAPTTKNIDVQGPEIKNVDVQTTPVQNVELGARTAHVDLAPEVKHIEVGGPEIKHIDLTPEVKHVGDPEL